MSFLVNIFNIILYRPLFNGLILLYNIIPGKDFGIAIIVLTAVIRFALAPLSKKSIQSQKAMAEIQPKVKEVQSKYKDDKEKQMKEMMALYKEHKVNPMSGCLPLLIQFPIIIALYQVFIKGLDPKRLTDLYSFISRPQTINVMFLGLFNLSQSSLFLAVLAGFFQFIQTKMMMGAGFGQNKGQKKIGGLDIASMMSHQMTYLMPLLTVYIAWKLPAALAIYWIVFTIFGIVQQHFTKVTV